MNEFDLIHRLTRSLPTNPSVVVGAGDDCAVLDVGMPDRLLLFKTDAVAEGVHFTPETAPEKIGHKALGRCLSDVAAMAGTPTAALVTIGLPAKFCPDAVEAIYAGLNALARRHQVAVVGGETTFNPGGIFISVAVLGWVPRGKGVLRSGAEVGDAIFVTGELGGSLAGKHLDFEPRLAEARWLAQEFSLHAMLDVSDGLAGDLRHILTASRVAAELLTSAIPISREARRAAKGPHSGRAPGVRPSSGAATSASSGVLDLFSAPGDAEPAAPEDGRTPIKPPSLVTTAKYAPAKPPLLAALTDGEDFELLFTVAGRDAVPVLDAWKKQFSALALTCIGKIKEGEGITLRDKQGVRPLTAHGYVHFS